MLDVFIKILIWDAEEISTTHPKAILKYYTMYCHGVAQTGIQSDDYKL
jgi:hypothetical protein